MSNALQLFRAGFDYLQIASHLNTTEAEVERQIHKLREQERENARIEADRKREDRRAYMAAYWIKNKDRMKEGAKAYQKRNRGRLHEIREAHS